jgi:predicted ATPase
MLETLHLKNVGPAKEMKLEFAPRLNVITGDNGLGKSFILDVAWWILTGTWFDNQVVRPIMYANSAQINSQTSNEFMARKFRGISTNEFNFIKQKWDVKWDSNTSQPSSIIIYQRINGLIGLYEPSRSKPRHRFLKNNDLWDGQKKNAAVSNGLISDLAFWQLENSSSFQQLKSALHILSPDPSEELRLGDLTRISIDDSREIPTLQMPYGQNVPIIYASAGIKRILSFAYALVWTWQEHLQIAKLTRQEPKKELILLIDEVETHLHPRWQQVILRSILNVVKEIMQEDVKIQIILTTHSPLVLQSLETVFDSEKDAWFDLDFDAIKKEVVLEKRDYFKRGSLNNWITSAAFDLPSSYTPEAKAVMDEVSDALKSDLTLEQAQALNAKLQDVLGDMDVFWVRWHSALERRGLEL